VYELVSQDETANFYVILYERLHCAINNMDLDKSRN
jgi:hypothetical protein